MVVEVKIIKKCDVKGCKHLKEGYDELCTIKVRGLDGKTRTLNLCSVCLAKLELLMVENMSLTDHGIKVIAGMSDCEGTHYDPSVEKLKKIYYSKYRRLWNFNEEDSWYGNG